MVNFAADDNSVTLLALHFKMHYYGEVVSAKPSEKIFISDIYFSFQHKARLTQSENGVNFLVAKP